MNAFSPVVMDRSALDRMMPMHLVVDDKGVIVHAGPTIAKAHPGTTLPGASFFKTFKLRRPRYVRTLEEVCDHAGSKVYLRMRDEARTPLIGTAICLPDQDRVLLNLSFGISVVEAVRRYNLAGSDFAPTDLTVEMLYLVEANAAVMDESGKLNTRLQGAKSAAEVEASSDTLTGLGNRRALDQVLDRLIGRAVPFTMMHLDLDFFKAVNDTLGHAAGDLVLKEVARILVEETRDNDTVARVGGDEFVLIFNDMTRISQLESIAARMIERLEQPVPFKDTFCRISASIGMVSSTRYDRPDAARMLHDADIALYASKARGRACFTTFTPDLALP